MTTLGDNWGAVDNAQPTENASALSMTYVNGKIREFQLTLNALDQGYQAALTVAGSPAIYDDDLRGAMIQSVNDFQSKKWMLRTTAEALNAGAAAVNAMGGRMPQLSIPGTLGALPLALPFAAVAALGTAATLIVWGRDWLRGVNDRLKTAQLLDAQATPEAKQELARSIAQTDAAIATAEANGFAALAPVLKWVAIGVGGWMLYRTIAPMLRARAD
jgi:hypothetical protein